MIELGVPESVADFIEGRTPKTIGAKHYMILLRQTKQYYPRYVERIMQLRRKAGITTA
jgi:intergrase/recombinase